MGSEMCIRDSVYTLGIGLSGTPNGSETLTVNPVDNGVYDGAGNEASTSQSNNTRALNEKVLPIISSVSLASDNATIAVTFSEVVHNTNGGSGALEASDFSFSISGGTATPSETKPTSISSNQNTIFTLGIGLSGTPNGAEVLTVNLLDDAVYDAAGNEAVPSQSNNTATLNDKTAPTISSAALAANNSYIDITLSEAAYNANSGSGALEVDDFALTFAQNSGSATAVSISSVRKNNHTAESSAGALAGGETVVRVFLSITGTPSGVETVTIKPVDASSIYDKVGNAMVSSQTTGAKTLNDKLVPTITSIFLAADNSTIKVNFSEAVFNANGGSSALQTSDFVFSIAGGTATLTSTTPSSISISGNAYTLGISISGSVDGDEVFVVNPVYNSIFDAVGNEASTSQSNNTVTLYDKVIPVITSVALASDNSTIAVTFSETVYNSTANNSALEKEDFAFSITGGTATLSSSTPSSISISGNVHTLGIGLSGTPNGKEVLKVNPKDDSIYDADDNEASTSQRNNTIALNDINDPTVTSVSSIMANGTYPIGSVVQVTTIFSEEVLVTGTPQITLETGTTDRAVNYASGSGTNTLIFNYTVASGDTTSDLDYTATTSLASVSYTHLTLPTKA